MEFQQLLMVIMNLSTLVFVVTSMLAMGLSLTVAEILTPLRNTRLVILALVANFVLVPFVAYLITKTFPISPGMQIGLILVATAAGAPFLPKLAQVAKGDLAFSVGLMVLLMVITILYMPFVLPLLVDGVAVNPWDIARSLIILMLIPLAVGLFVKARNVKGAETFQEYLSKLSNIAMGLLVVTGLLGNLNAIVKIFGTSGILATLLFLALSFVIGFLLGGKKENIRSVLGLGTAQRNLAAALVVVTANFAEDPDVIVMVLVLGLLGLIGLMVTARTLGGGKKEIP